MANIQISDDTMDLIFKDILIDDYIGLLKNISTMKNKANSNVELTQYELDDLANWQKIVNAIDIVFDWYLTATEANDIRSKGRKI